MKNILSLCSIAFCIVFIYGCASSSPADANKSYSDNLPKPKHSEPRHDIFNLNWGMKKDACFKMCDWGGKSDTTYSVPCGVHVLKFSKGELFAELQFNDNDELYKVVMMGFFSASKLPSAKDFYFYLDEILGRKYTRIDSSYDKQMFEQNFKCQVISISKYKNDASIVALLLYPAPAKRKDIDFVLDLTYYSKKIKRTHILQKDTLGL